MKSLSDSQNGKVVLGGIILLAIALRLWGISHGYPYSYYPDEAHFVKRALAFGSGDLNPHWFHKPAFFMYLLFFEYGIFYLVGELISLWHGVEGFAIFFVKNPGPFYLIGRLTVSAFSVGIVFLTYLVARRLFNRNTGLLAALIITLSFGHVMVSKDIKADIPCAFFTLASVYFLICYLRESRKKDIFFSAIFAGIGTATKSYSIVMFLPIFVALMTDGSMPVWCNLFPKIRLFLACVLSFYIVYFICSPYNFIDPMGRQATFGPLYSLGNKIWHLLSGAESYVQQGNEEIASGILKKSLSFKVYMMGIVSYADQIYQGMGGISLILSFIGILYWIFRRPDRIALCFWLFPAVFVSVAIFMHPGYSEIRHQVVIYPFLAVAAAFVFVKCFKAYAYQKLLTVGLMILLLIPLIHIVRYNLFLSKEDTRNLAKEWVEENIGPDSKILIDEDSVKLRQSEKSIRKVISETQHLLKEAGIEGQKGSFTKHYSRYLEYQMLAARDSICYDLREIRWPWWRESYTIEGVHLLISDTDRDMGNHLRPVGVENLSYYVENGFGYVIVHSIMYKKFINETSVAERFPHFKAFYRELFVRGTLVKEFLPDGECKRPGPVIKIFRLPH